MEAHAQDEAFDRNWQTLQRHVSHGGQRPRNGVAARITPFLPADCGQASVFQVQLGLARVSGSPDGSLLSAVQVRARESTRDDAHAGPAHPASSSAQGSLTQLHNEVVAVHQLGRPTDYAVRPPAHPRPSVLSTNHRRVAADRAEQPAAARHSFDCSG